MGLSAPGSFVHLDVRSYFSLKEGAFSPEALARRAAHLGMPAVALTDRDGLYGAARFAKACAREGIQPILGAALTMPGGLSVQAIALNEAGYANLCRAITDGHMTGERGNPHVALEQLCAHAGGMAVVLGATSAVGKLAAHGALGAAVEALAPWKDAFGERCFIGVEHLREQDSDARVRALLQVAERKGVQAIATNPVRYLVREDAFLADALECMRKIVPLNATNVTRTNAEGFLASARLMRERFRERPELIDHTLALAEMVEFDIGLGKIHFPDFPTPEGQSAEALLRDRCERGFEARGVQRNRQTHDRLEHELQMIGQLGFAAYFLTVADIADDIRAMGIRCACRGSAASSLVTYLTRISDVDAVRHDLVFERFMNPLRKDLPDIDIDVESARREDVYDMILSRYGDQAACVAMIDTYRARSAVREVGKMLGIPETELGVVAKAFPHIGVRHLRKAIDALPELAGANLNAGQLEMLFTVAERLAGFPRHIALHPCGIVLSDDDLVRRVPMERSAQGYRMIHADKDDVELLGYLKLDVLGVRMLSAMTYALGELARTDDLKLDLDRIPLDDAKTFELIRASDTIGCFQIESPGQRELLQKFQPTRWEDLIIDISLFRPGPVKSDMVTPFLRRRLEMEAPTYTHPSLRPALQETHGVIVYHEQVMRVIAAIGGYPLPEADAIRRALGGDERAVRKLRKAFLDHAKETNNIGKDIAEPIWDHIAQFASFGFCKAHAAAFAVPTYQSAYLKAHYPAHLVAGLLTHDPGMYPRRLILEDAREHGIGILPLDVNLSEADYTVEKTDAAAGGEAGEGEYSIRLALKDVHGMSQGELRSILQSRSDHPFTSVPDFMQRTRVARPVVEAITHAGGFDQLKRSDGTPASGTRRDRLFVAMTEEVAAHENEQMTLAVHAPLETVLPDYDDAERVKAELEVLGVDASRHLISFFGPLLADMHVTQGKDLWRMRSDTLVTIAGVKVSSQTPAVRSGKRIIFVTVDDATGPVEATVFEQAQARCARTVFHSFLLAMRGKLRRTGVCGVSVVVEDAWDLTVLQQARSQGKLAEAMAAGPAWPTGGTPIAKAPRKVWHSSPGSAGG